MLTTSLASRWAATGRFHGAPYPQARSRAAATGRRAVFLMLLLRLASLLRLLVLQSNAANMTPTRRSS